jgi:hypothetical protein
MRLRCYGRAAAVVWILHVAGPASAPAQSPEPIEDLVRTLYSAAAYEEALAALGDSKQPEAEQYRVLSLLALGRQHEAKTALDALVTAAPDFMFSEDVPPRFAKMLSQSRQEVLPSILRALFTEARDRYQVQEYDDARAGFERIVSLSTHPSVKGIGDIPDLVLLADGYLDLLKELETRKPPLTPGPLFAASLPGAALTPVVRTAPSATRQPLPTWPIEAGPIERASVGLLHIVISPMGQVLSATMIRSVHPRYDRLLLASTKVWRYNPATLNGSPVESESTVEIRPQAGLR